MGGTRGSFLTIHTVSSGDKIWAVRCQDYYIYSTGVTQFRTTHSSPHWSSLHEVMEMQTKQDQESVLYELHYK